MCKVAIVTNLAGLRKTIAEARQYCARGVMYFHNDTPHIFKEKENETNFPMEEMERTSSPIIIHMRVPTTGTYIKDENNHPFFVRGTKRHVIGCHVGSVSDIPLIKDLMRTETDSEMAMLAVANYCNPWPIIDKHVIGQLFMMIKENDEKEWRYCFYNPNLKPTPYGLETFSITGSNLGRVEFLKGDQYIWNKLACIG